MKNKILLILTILLSGCATVDKAFIPVDNVVNSTHKTYQSAGHSVSETMNDISNSAASLKSNFYESSLVKLFVSDETLTQNREQNYVIWNDASTYNAFDIIKSNIDTNVIQDPAALSISQQMKILKEYFFVKLKEEHASQFSSSHKKPEFNEFLTDRENIEQVHLYKIALSESEHKWRIDLTETQKKVAQLMLSTLYSKPIIKYVSYDPYDEELYMTVESSNTGFMEKIKIDAEKDQALKMKQSISQIKPYVFFKFDDNILEFVGINLNYNNESYICDMVDTAYTRQSDVVFTSDDISLKTMDVQYYDIVKNVQPPEWFNNISMEGEPTIGFGEGISKDDAKKEAFSDIAMSIKTTVSSNFETEKTLSGSTYASSTKSSSQQKVEDISITGSKVIKVEKKDGLWFVAILYDD